METDPRYCLLHADICDKATVTEAARGADAVVDFAAETHMDRSIAEPEAFLRTDILGTHSLLEVVRS